MKTLYLMRHAGAEEGHDKDDLKRNLTITGKKEAYTIAEQMLNLKLRPGHIVSSHANRAYQTAQIIAESLAFPVKNIEIEEKIYAGDEDEIMEVIEEHDDAFESLMIVGHNPYISTLAHKIGDFANTLEPAQLIVFECEANSWENFTDEEIKIKEIISPNDNENIPDSAR